jgi:thioredoxin-related protein
VNKTFFILFILSVLLISPLFTQPIDSPLKQVERPQKFDPSRNAHKDIREAMTVAKKLHARILLDVGGEWCSWCHRLDSLFLLNKDLEEYLHAHYVVVKINVSKENKNEEVLAKYPKIAGYPHLFVLDAQGTVLHSQDTGELEFPSHHPIKGHDKNKVFTFLKKWAK